MSKIIISKSNYIHNINIISGKVGGIDKIMLVLKDNAYGHGILEIANLAKDLGIDKVAVRNEREAFLIKDLFNKILILSHTPTSNESDFFIYALNSKDDIKKIKPGTKIHIAVDTFMRRNGILCGDFEEVFNMALSYDICICGAYTHFRCADEFNGDFFIQRDNFLKSKEKLIDLSSKFGLTLDFHSCNSASVERCNNFYDDYSRVGIAQFGYSQFVDIGLKPVLKLYADKMSSRILKKGERVGYGGVFCADKDIAIATYDLGYSDGLFRCNNGKNYLLDDGNLPILGRMSMDSFISYDVGNEVCVINDARVWANYFATIEYEILVKLSQNIKRVVI